MTIPTRGVRLVPTGGTTNGDDDPGEAEACTDDDAPVDQLLNPYRT